MTDEERIEAERKKEFLGQYKKLGMQVKRINMQMDEIRMNKMLPSNVIDGMPHGSSNSDLSAYIAKYDEKMRTLITVLAFKQYVLQSIIESVEKMQNEQEKLLLYYRYIKCYTWDKITIEMEVSWKQVHRLHARALKHYEIPEIGHDYY